MKEKKLTPWFPATVKPTRIGVFRVKGNIEGFAYWTGCAWGWTNESVLEADSDRDPYGAIQSKEWRGLAKEPK